MTADMAYGLSQLGLNPAGSTFGNPWIRQFDEDGKPVWREDDECHVLSHVPPPSGFPFACFGCNKIFKDQLMVDEDKIRIAAFTQAEKKAHMLEHFGNYPHQRPIFDIPPSKYLPPIYHYGENLFQWRFKHLIWSQADNEIVKHKINSILSEDIGYCHLPPKVGDEVYMMSFIGILFLHFLLILFLLLLFLLLLFLLLLLLCRCRYLQSSS